MSATSSVLLIVALLGLAVALAVLRLQVSELRDSLAELRDALAEVAGHVNKLEAAARAEELHGYERPRGRVHVSRGRKAAGPDDEEDQ